MSRGRVLFVGCGPGAADLLTLRAVRAIAAADVVIWSPTLLARAALDEHVRPGVEVLAWPPATHDDILAVYDRAAAEDLRIVRLKGGDPTLFGELGDELATVRSRGLAAELVPGVSAVTAGAAALGCELGTPDTPLLLAAGGADYGAGVVGVFNAGRRGPLLAREFAERGWSPSTPCAVLVDVSRSNEIIVCCRLDELAETIADYGAGTLTTVLAGPGLRPASGGPGGA